MKKSFTVLSFGLFLTLTLFLILSTTVPRTDAGKGTTEASADHTTESSGRKDSGHRKKDKKKRKRRRRPSSWEEQQQYQHGSPQQYPAGMSEERQIIDNPYLPQTEEELLYQHSMGEEPAQSQQDPQGIMMYGDETGAGEAGAEAPALPEGLVMVPDEKAEEQRMMMMRAEQEYARKKERKSRKQRRGGGSRRRPPPGQYQRWDEYPQESDAAREYGNPGTAHHNTGMMGAAYQPQDPAGAVPYGYQQSAQPPHMMIGQPQTAQNPYPYNNPNPFNGLNQGQTPRAGQQAPVPAGLNDPRFLQATAAFQRAHAVSDYNIRDTGTGIRIMGNGNGLNPTGFYPSHPSAQNYQGPPSTYERQTGGQNNPNFTAQNQPFGPYGNRLPAPPTYSPEGTYAMQQNQLHMSRSMQSAGNQVERGRSLVAGMREPDPRFSGPRVPMSAPFMGPQQQPTPQYQTVRAQAGAVYAQPQGNGLQYHGQPQMMMAPPPPVPYYQQQQQMMMAQNQPSYQAIQPQYDQVRPGAMNPMGFEGAQSVREGDQAYRSVPEDDSEASYSNESEDPSSDEEVTTTASRHRDDEELTTTERPKKKSKRKGKKDRKGDNGRKSKISYIDSETGKPIKDPKLLQQLGYTVDDDEVKEHERKEKRERKRSKGRRSKSSKKDNDDDDEKEHQPENERSISRSDILKSPGGTITPNQVDILRDKDDAILKKILTQNEFIKFKGTRGVGKPRIFRRPREKLYQVGPGGATWNNHNPYQQTLMNQRRQFTLAQQVAHSLILLPVRPRVFTYAPPSAGAAVTPKPVVIEEIQRSSTRKFSTMTTAAPRTTPKKSHADTGLSYSENDFDPIARHDSVSRGYSNSELDFNKINDRPQQTGDGSRSWVVKTEVISERPIVVSSSLPHRIATTNADRQGSAQDPRRDEVFRGAKSVDGSENEMLQKLLEGKKTGDRITYNGDLYEIVTQMIDTRSSYNGGNRASPSIPPQLSRKKRSHAKRKRHNRSHVFRIRDISGDDVASVPMDPVMNLPQAVKSRRKRSPSRNLGPRRYKPEIAAQGEVEEVAPAEEEAAPEEAVAPEEPAPEEPAVEEAAAPESIQEPPSTYPERLPEVVEPAGSPPELGGEGSATGYAGEATGEVGGEAPAGADPAFEAPPAGTEFTGEATGGYESGAAVGAAPRETYGQEAPAAAPGPPPSPVYSPPYVAPSPGYPPAYAPAESGIAPAPYSGGYPSASSGYYGPSPMGYPMAAPAAPASYPGYAPGPPPASPMMSPPGYPPFSGYPRYPPLFAGPGSYDGSGIDTGSGPYQPEAGAAPLGDSGGQAPTGYEGSDAGLAAPISEANSYPYFRGAFPPSVDVGGLEISGPLLSHLGIDSGGAFAGERRYPAAASIGDAPQYAPSQSSGTERQQSLTDGTGTYGSDSGTVYATSQDDAERTMVSRLSPTGTRFFLERRRPIAHLDESGQIIQTAAQEDYEGESYDGQQPSEYGSSSESYPTQGDSSSHDDDYDGEDESPSYGQPHDSNFENYGQGRPTGRTGEVKFTSPNSQYTVRRAPNGDVTDYSYSSNSGSPGGEDAEEAGEGVEADVDDNIDDESNANYEALSGSEAVQTLDTAPVSAYVPQIMSSETDSEGSYAPFKYYYPTSNLYSNQGGGGSGGWGMPPRTNWQPLVINPRPKQEQEKASWLGRSHTPYGINQPMRTVLNRPITNGRNLADNRFTADPAHGLMATSKNERISNRPETWLPVSLKGIETNGVDNKVDTGADSPSGPGQDGADLALMQQNYYPNILPWFYFNSDASTNAARKPGSDDQNSNLRVPIMPSNEAQARLLNLYTHRLLQQNRQRMAYQNTLNLQRHQQTTTHSKSTANSEINEKPVAVNQGTVDTRKPRRYPLNRGNSMVNYEVGPREMVF